MIYWCIVSIKEYTCKEKGLTACEKWCRKVNENGHYRFKKVEGDMNAIIEPIFGPEMKVRMLLCYLFHAMFYIQLNHWIHT